jgi:hypothetical protein
VRLTLTNKIAKAFLEPSYESLVRAVHFVGGSVEKLRCNFGFYLFLLGITFAPSVLLTWDDNSENEQGFIIERTVSDDCVDGWEVIAYTGVNQNSLMDIRVPGACYRIAAYDENGSSTYSNIAQVLLEPPL